MYSNIPDNFFDQVPTTETQETQEVLPLLQKPHKPQTTIEKFSKPIAIDTTPKQYDEFVFEDPLASLTTSNSGAKPIHKIMTELELELHNALKTTLSDTDSDDEVSITEMNHEIVNKPKVTPESPQTTPVVEQAVQKEVFFDPEVKRIFVLTILEINQETPTPQITTQTWGFSSQYRVFARVLTKMLDLSRKRNDNDLYTDIFDTAETDDSNGDPFQNRQLFDSEGKCLSIFEKVDQCCKFDAKILKYGLNNFTEDISDFFMDCIIHCHAIIAEYYVKNNDIYNGIYHSFILTRYITDSHTKQTFTREINVNTATKQDVIKFFQ